MVSCSKVIRYNIFNYIFNLDCTLVALHIFWSLESL